MDAASADLLRERHTERATIESATRAVTDGVGRLVFISGPPGIGKSSLAALAVADARARGHTVLRARCGELEGAAEFGVLRQLLGRLLTHASPDQRDRWLAGAAQTAAAVLTAGPGATPDARRTGLFHSLYWLLVNLADDGPLVIVVDDAQWADELSARFFGFLAARLPTVSILLALAARPGAAAIDALALDPAAAVLRPAPIGASGVAGWLADELGTMPCADVTQACLQATGGNPFLLREFVREIHREHVDLTVGPGPLAALTPRAVTTAVLLRLAALPGAAARLAEAVAALEVSDLETAARLADLDPSGAGRALGHLVDADILTAAHDVGFVHPLVRQALLHDLNPDRRQQLHGRAAELLYQRGAASNRVAVQLLLAPPGLPEWALSLLRDTGRNATSLGSHTIAVQCLRRALTELGAGAEQVDVLLELGMAEVAAANHEGIDHLAAAAARASTVGDTVRTSIALAGALRTASQGRRAVAVLHNAQAGLDDRTDPGGGLRTSIDIELLACTSTSRAARLLLAPWRAEHVRDPGGIPATGWQALLLASVALDGALDARPLDVVLDRLARTVAAVPAVEESWLRAHLVSMCALAYLCVEEFEPAEALIDRLVHVATRQSLVDVLAATLAGRASLELRRGNLDRASADAHRALELADEAGTVHVSLPRAGAVLLSVAAAQGTDAPAQLVNYELDDDSTASRLLAHSRTELLLARGEDVRAAAELLAYGARNIELGWSGCATPWRSQAGLALTRLGDSERGRALITEELELAHRSGTPRAISVATAATAALTSGPRRLQLLTESVNLLEGTGSRLEHAQALTDLGAELQRAGRLAAARETLRRGHELALQCRATILADRAAKELRKAGARPRRTSLTGVESLTPAERRVAELVADGHSNRGAAQQLFLTEKTIETHLGHVFRKVGVHTRHQLKAALAR